MPVRVIERRYAARGAALEVFRRREPEVLIAGPAGTGKSRACLEKLHAMCLANPGMRALIVRKTHVSLTSTGLQTFKQHVLVEAEQLGIVHWYGGSGEKPAGYIYSNGSFVAVGGMDKPTKIMSSEYDLIYVQEATELTVEDWEHLKSRLRNGVVSFQQLLADCNPQGPKHWLKVRCDEGKCIMLYGQHTDNPILFDNSGIPTARGVAYLELLNNLTGVRKIRLLGGQWVAAEGIIYEGWDEALHLSDRIRLPYEWSRYWAIDFGYTNPFVWQQWAVDDDGRLWLEKEIYRAKTLVEDHAKRILSIVTKQDGKTWKYPKPRAIICDHDAEDRATLERHLGDMGTVAAQKTVSDGIQAFQARLRVAGDGQPRLRVLRTALVERDEELATAGKPLGFAAEITGYVWAPGQDGKPTKEDPVKVDDHSMDAARYMVADLDLAPRFNIRWM
jgi:PBSX family phage terminase large subunit